MDIGWHTVYLQISDLHGNTATKEWKFNILPDEDKEDEYLWEVPSGRKKEFTLQKSDETSIIHISIKTVSNLEDVKATVNKLEQTPEGTPEPPIEDGQVYKILDMKITAGVEDDEIYVSEETYDKVTIRFKVEKAWLKENKIDKDSIQLLRYHEGEWQILATSYIWSTSDYLIYDAKTPGFSTFAVVGSTQVSQPYDEGVPEIPLTAIIIFVSIIAVILVIVLFKARYIYYGDQTHTEKSNKKGK
jgi:PGF-pre-PGF domain-containing protein